MSKITNGEFNDALSDVIDYLYPWEKEARIDFEFSALKQWRDEDKELLEEEGRPALTFDRTRPIIASVAGSEITQRYEPKFLPRDADLNDMDVQYSDAGNKVYRWIRDRGDFAHHESLAFQSCLVCGVGCTELYLDYEEDSDGVIKMLRVPIFEIGWDPASVDPNLLDAKYVIRDRWVDEDEVIQRFGREAAQSARLLGSTDKPNSPRGFIDRIFTRDVDDPRHTYFEGKSGKYYDLKRKQIRVWEMVRKVKTYQTRIIPPSFLGESEDIYLPKDKGADAIRDLQQAVMAYNAQVMDSGGMLPPEDPLRFMEDFPTTEIKRSYHAGNEVISENTLPMHYFPYQFMTAFEDWSEPSRRYYFGLMRSMRDPQKYANKFASHMAHMWASNPKGAIIAEEDMFDSPEEAMKQWGSAKGMIFVESGKMQTPKPKYDIIPSSVNFSGISLLLDHSVNSIPAAAGVSEQYTVGNPSDLRRTAASAVQSVKESNQVTISQPFDSLRLYKRIQGRLILDHVAAYVPIKQLQRLLNQEEQAEFVGPANSGTLHQQYEVIAEEAPASKNKQMEVFNKIMETSFIPQLLEIGVTVPPELAKFFPFPPDINAEFERVLGAVKEIMDLQNQATQMQLQMQVMQMQAAMGQVGLEADVQQDTLEAQGMEAELAKMQMGTQLAMAQTDPMSMMGPDPMMAEGEEGDIPPEEQGE